MEERERVQQVAKEASAAAAAAAAQAARPPVKLSVVQHILYDVPPAWRENYSKEVLAPLIRAPPGPARSATPNSA